MPHHLENIDSACILCGGSQRILLHRQNDWRVYKCTGCGLGFLDPRPAPDELAKLYGEEYFRTHFGKRLDPESPAGRRSIAQEQHRLRFFRRFKKKGLVMDIGCGMGYFLYACRREGYDVRGIDLSEDSASYVRDILHIPVTMGNIEGIDIPKNSLDIITMWHFLEHAAHPQTYLRKAREWLKPDGLLIVDCPNYAGTDAQKTWERWAQWDLPYHLYHFTDKTLRGLLEKEGFEAVTSKSYLSEYVKEKIQAIPLLKPFARPIAKLYSGHSFAVLARKNPHYREGV